MGRDLSYRVVPREGYNSDDDQKDLIYDNYEICKSRHNQYLPYEASLDRKQLLAQIVCWMEELKGKLDVDEEEEDWHSVPDLWEAIGVYTKFGAMLDNDSLIVFNYS